MKNIYVGNLSFSIDSSQLNDLFSSYGAVSSANVVMDRDTGRSKGFGFVEMSSASDAESAINSLNGKDVDGRSLTVNEARPRESNSFGSRPGSARRF